MTKKKSQNGFKNVGLQISDSKTVLIFRILRFGFKPGFNIFLVSTSRLKMFSICLVDLVNIGFNIVGLTWFMKSVSNPCMKQNNYVIYLINL